MKCPVCNHFDTLVYEQEALIMLPLKNGARLPSYWIPRNVSILEGSGMLMCLACGSNSDDDQAIEQMRDFLEGIHEDEERSERHGNT